MLANISLVPSKVKPTAAAAPESGTNLSHGHQAPGGKRDKYKKGKQKII